MEDANSSKAGPKPSLSPVIVTGGCGFIGFHVVTGLLEIDATCEIHVIDINIDRNRVDNVTYYSCDISSLPDVEVVFASVRPKTIFHIACPDSMIQQPSVFHKVNVVGAQNLLSAARAIKDADETFPVLQYPEQKQVYTLTKAQAGAEILRANRKDGDSSMLTVSIWPATTFGPRDTICMGKIVANARAGKAHIQMGPGQNYHDFVYVTNLVDGHILAAQALVRAYGKSPPAQDMRVDGQSFIITNNEPIEFWEFQRAIAASIGLPVRKEDVKIMPIWAALVFAFITEWVTWITSFGRKHPIVTREAVHLTTITRTLNCEKAMRVLGYKPQVGMTEGLAIAGKWFMAEEEKAQESRKSV